MNYIGNQREWITDDLINLLLNKQGDLIPIWDPKRLRGHPLLEQITEQGLSWFGEKMPEQYFRVFRSNSPDLKDYNFNLPKLPKLGSNTFWWFVKLNPGELQLMHYDMHVLGVFHNDQSFSQVTKTVEIKNPVRYTMFLEDWQPGHVFVWKDQTIANYRAGDIFEWSDPELLHGVVNLSFSPRLTLQITSHD
jgi:hypothetical protein